MTGALAALLPRRRRSSSLVARTLTARSNRDSPPIRATPCPRAPSPVARQ